MSVASWLSSTDFFPKTLLWHNGHRYAMDLFRVSPEKLNAIALTIGHRSPIDALASWYAQHPELFITPVMVKEHNQAKRNTHERHQHREGWEAFISFPVNQGSHMRICYVLSYRSPAYIRTQTFLSALRQLSGVELRIAINARVGLGRYVDTWRQVQKIRMTFDPHLYILGFRGHEFYWLLRKLVGRKPIVFDAMMSPASALSEEGNAGLPGRLAAQMLLPVERGIMRDADLVLTDTPAHVAHFSRLFELAEGQVASIPVGAVERANVIYAPVEEAERNRRPLSVLFYGTFLPLHGIEVILEAVSLLQDLSLRFDFIGGNSKWGQRLADRFACAGAVRHTWRPWTPFNELITKTIPNADICLGGPFGDTPQARRVITGKTSQALALGKATLIGAAEDNPGFIDQENCLLVPQGSAEALANALRWAVENRDRLDGIGQRGRALYMRELSVDVVARRLAEELARFGERQKTSPHGSDDAPQQQY
jgi:hypothetical protein